MASIHNNYRVYDRINIGNNYENVGDVVYRNDSLKVTLEDGERKCTICFEQNVVFFQSIDESFDFERMDEVVGMLGEDIVSDNNLYVADDSALLRELAESGYILENHRHFMILACNYFLDIITDCEPVIIEMRG